MASKSGLTPAWVFYLGHILSIIVLSLCQVEYRFQYNQPLQAEHKVHAAQLTGTGCCTKVSRNWPIRTMWDLREGSLKRQA